MTRKNENDEPQTETSDSSVPSVMLSALPSSDEQDEEHVPERTDSQQSM